MPFAPRNRPRRGRQPPPDYLSGAFQRRLLAMLGSLVLVVLMMRVASRPESWGWIWRFSDRPQGSTSGPPGPPPQAPAPLGARRPPAVADRFLAPAAVAATPTQEDAQTTPNNPPAGLNRPLLGSVTDDTYFRPDEREAWTHVLAWLKEADAETLAATAAGEVSSLQLLSQMPAYRGQLVRVRGLVRRAERLLPPASETEVRARWRCWLQDDAGTSPIVIYCLDLPTAFPLGANLREPATFVGVAYKRWPYQAEAGLLAAPVVLAKTAIWTPQPAAPPQRPPTFRQLLLGMLAAAALALLAVKFISTSSRRRRRRLHDTELPDRLPLQNTDRVGEPDLPAPDGTDKPRIPFAEPPVE